MAFNSGDLCMIRIDTTWKTTHSLPWCLVKVGDISGIDTTADDAMVNVTVYKAKKYESPWSVCYWKDSAGARQGPTMDVPAASVEMSGLALTAAKKLTKVSLRRVQSDAGSAGSL